MACKEIQASWRPDLHSNKRFVFRYHIIINPFESLTIFINIFLKIVFLCLANYFHDKIQLLT